MGNSNESLIHIMSRMPETNTQSHLPLVRHGVRKEVPVRSLAEVSRRGMDEVHQTNQTQEEKETRKLFPLVNVG